MHIDVFPDWTLALPRSVGRRILRANSLGWTQRHLQIVFDVATRDRNAVREEGMQSLVSRAGWRFPIRSAMRSLDDSPFQNENRASEKKCQPSCWPGGIAAFDMFSITASRSIDLQSRSIGIPARQVLSEHANKPPPSYGAGSSGAFSSA